MLLTALLVMLFATTAQHLGLTQAVAEIAGKIAGCSMCCTFWCCVAVLLFLGADVITTAALSLLMAYLSHWFALVLVRLNSLHSELWERTTKKRPRK